MTEMEFSSILVKCETESFSKHQCIKIHRAIKTLLNAPQSVRYDIDIGQAIIYLINEDKIFKPKNIPIQPEKIKAAFKNYSAKQILKMGKKPFIDIVKTQTQIKMGHGTKLWTSIKSFIEDSNVKVPQQIIIKDYKDDDDDEDNKNKKNDDQNEKDDDYKKPENTDDNYDVDDVNDDKKPQNTKSVDKKTSLIQKDNNDDMMIENVNEVQV